MRIVRMMVIVMAALLITGCGTADKGDIAAQASDTASAAYKEQSAGVSEQDSLAVLLSDEQVLDKVRSYCFSNNPELEGIMNEGVYPVYWTVSSSDEDSVNVLFRSYTGAMISYKVDRSTGEICSSESAD